MCASEFGRAGSTADNIKQIIIGVSRETKTLTLTLLGEVNDVRAFVIGSRHAWRLSV